MRSCVQIFETSLERLGRILSRKWDIRVVFEADKCATDGKVVCLPTVPPDASKNLLDAMQGHLDHEAAHCVFTDFTAVKKAVKKKPKLLTAINALEDPRIEIKWCQMYPGAVLNLRRGSQWAWKQTVAVKKMKDFDTGKMREMRAWDNLSDFGKFLYSSIVYTQNDFNTDHWFLNDIVEKSILDDVVKNRYIFEAALYAKDTAAVIPLAEKLLEFLEEEEDEEEENPTGLSGDLRLDLDSGEGTDGGISAAKPHNPMYKKCKDSKGRYAVTQKELNNDQKAVGKGEQLKAAAKSELSTKIQMEFVDSPSAKDYRVFTTSGDVFEKMSLGSKSAYNDFLKSANKYVAPMRRKLARALLAKNTTRWACGKDVGRVDQRRLHYVALGTSNNVFRQKQVAPSFDTAVLLMVDHSGSMGGQSLLLAAQTSAVFGEILNQLGISFGVLGFSTGSSFVAADRRNAASDSQKDIYTRWGNLWIGQYKTFDQSWKSSSRSVLSMSRNGKYNTYDGEALRYGAQELLARPEKRKILFWLNDGEPYPNSQDDLCAHQRYIKGVAKVVERHVELVAVGISTDAVKKIYTNWIQVSSLDDLPKTCLVKLERLLRKKYALDR